MAQMNPADIKPTRTFGQAMRAAGSNPALAGTAEPLVANPTDFRLALFSKGVQLGWLGQNGSGWAILVTDKAQSLALELYPQNGVNYYRIKGSGSYMSVSTGSYVGFYNWSGARGWTVQGNSLVSDYNGQKLSFYSTANGYLYAWDAYTVLDVKFEPLVPPPIVKPPLTSLIEHVVVLMLENRSFDNMFGGLYPNKTQAEYRGLNGLSQSEKSNPLDPRNPAKGSVTAFQAPANYPTWIMPYPDPGELFDDMNEQLFGASSPGPCKPGALPAMQGFAWNYSQQPGAPEHDGGPTVMPVPRNIMQFYSEDAVRMSSFLARQFAVCDDWFAAGPVQTISNRTFAHCGTPGLVPDTNNARINNPDFMKGWSLHHPPTVVDKTVFQLLDEAYPGEINWKVYYHDAPISALCTYVYNHWSWNWDGGNVYHFQEELGSGTNFEYDIVNHRLPMYSFIEPRYTNTVGGTVNSNHPGGAGIDIHDPNGSSLPPPISVLDGEYFLKEVYEILARHPETFKKTLLIVIYDEHGGLWDHVQTPCAVSPFVKPPDNFPYDRYGVRIPAILVNPCIPPGTIYRASDPGKHFDHTSLISTICAQFGLKGTLTPRSTAAPTLKNLIPDNGKVYTRPAPPVLQPAEPAAAPAQPEAIMDLAAATAVVGAQKHPHSLACVLLPLLNLEQQRLANRRSSTG